MKKGSYTVFHLLPVTAAFLAWIGDLLLGYVQPGGMGMYGMVQTGWADVAFWRPALSMAFAAVAFPLQAVGLYAAARQMTSVSPRTGRRFFVLGGLAVLGGLFIHAFFCLPQAAYRFMAQGGDLDRALRLTDRLYAVMTPTIGITLALYAVALVFMFGTVVTGKTPYPRWCAAANPLAVACVTVPVWLAWRDSATAYAFMLGTPNLGMLLFFLVTAVQGRTLRKEGRNLPLLGL
ncbi:MAG: hypothetical protein KBA30_06735 [Clostridia bacterium]|nr:hypothetical protein [Clostridia bacterium]